MNRPALLHRHGRASRRAFWVTYAGCLAAQAMLATSLLMAAAWPRLDAALAASSFVLPVKVAATARRAHDTGTSAWAASWLLAQPLFVATGPSWTWEHDVAAVLVLVGLINLLVVWLVPGEPRTNRYGPPAGKPASDELVGIFE